MKYLETLVLSAALAASAPAWSHGSGDHAPKARAKAAISKEEHPFGREGDPKKVTRTIRVEMHDTMRFLAAGPGVVRAGGGGAGGTEIRVNEGDTVKFIVSNDGKVMHEMVIGTMKDLKAHADMMRKHPSMEHDEPYMAHVAPGKRGEVVWQFTKAGEFYYACLLPGHFEAGMIGKIVVTPRRT